MRGGGRVARTSGKHRTPLGAAGSLDGGTRQTGLRLMLGLRLRLRFRLLVGVGVVGTVGTVVVVVALVTARVGVGVGVGQVIFVVQRGPSGRRGRLSGMHDDSLWNLYTVHIYLYRK